MGQIRTLKHWYLLIVRIVICAGDFVFSTRHNMYTDVLNPLGDFRLLILYYISVFLILICERKDQIITNTVFYSHTKIAFLNQPSWRTFRSAPTARQSWKIYSGSGLILQMSDRVHGGPFVYASLFATTKPARRAVCRHVYPLISNRTGSSSLALRRARLTCNEASLSFRGNAFGPPGFPRNTIKFALFPTRSGAPWVYRTRALISLKIVARTRVGVDPGWERHEFLIKRRPASPGNLCNEN